MLLHRVTQWIEAFNAHDVATIAALYVDSAELFDSGMRYPRHGRIEITRWFEGRFQGMPTIRYKPTGQMLVQADQVAVPWTTYGQGPRFLGQAWLVRPFQVDGISVFTLQDGYICKQRGYYDHLAVVEQLLPPLKWLLPARL